MNALPLHMELSHTTPLLFLLFLFLLFSSAADACDRCVHKSRAAFHRSSSALDNGACGYGSMAGVLTGGYFASASPALFRDGLGCGGCFQVRCKNAALCSSKGVKVILTDKNTSNQTDLVLSKVAFSAMAKNGNLAQQLINLGIVDAEYKRIPCEYPNHNFSVRVQQSSLKPYYLETLFLYQGGQTDMYNAYVSQVGIPSWQYMTRVSGAVWSTDSVPAGALQFQMLVTGGYDGSWVWADREVLPADWKTGVVYDTGLQITDLAQEACYPCDTSKWA